MAEFPEVSPVSSSGLSPAELSDEFAAFGEDMLQAGLAQPVDNKILPPPGLGPQIEFMDIGGRQFVSTFRLAFPPRPDRFTHEVEILLPGGRTLKENLAIFRRFYFDDQGNTQGSRLFLLSAVDFAEPRVDAFFQDMIAELQFNSHINP